MATATESLQAREADVTAARWPQVATLTAVGFGAPVLDIGWVAHLGW